MINFFIGKDLDGKINISGGKSRNFCEQTFDVLMQKGTYG